MEEDRPYAVYIFDADGTLRRCTVEGQPCPNRDGEWELMEGVREKLSSLPAESVIGIASNQGGISLGYFTAEVARDLLFKLYEEATGKPVPHTGLIRYCPHAPALRCACRKPEPKMLLLIHNTAAEILGYDVEAKDVLYVGDLPSDEQAAFNAGYAFQHADHFFSRRKEEACPL